MNLPSYDLRETLAMKPLLVKHINDGTVMEFDDDLIVKIKRTNVLLLRDFFEIFEEGLNIGECGITSRYLSYLFDRFTLIEKGTCEILKGTKNSPKGEHAWLLVNGYIYDTTLMLKIHEDAAYNVFGYVPYNEVTSKVLTRNKMYIMQKEIAMDTSNMKWKLDLIKEFEEFLVRSSFLEVV